MLENLDTFIQYAYLHRAGVLLAFVGAIVIGSLLAIDRLSKYKSKVIKVLIKYFYRNDPFGQAHAENMFSVAQSRIILFGVVLLIIGIYLLQF